MGLIFEQTSKGVVWSAIERFGSQGVQFILGLILARLLLPSDFGTIGILTIFISLSQTIVDSGFSNALIRLPKRTELDYSTSFFANVIIGVLCYLLLYVSAPSVASFFKIPILCSLLRVISINVILNSFIIVQIVKLTVKIDFKTQAKASIISTIISGVVGVVLAYNGLGVWSLAFQTIISTIMKVILLWTYTKWIPLFCFSWHSFSSLFSFGGKVLLSSILNDGYNHLNTIVIGKCFSARDLGFYSRGQLFPSFISQNFTNVVQRVTYPILAKYQNDTIRLISIYRQYIIILSMGIIFFLFLLASLGRPIVLLLLSDRWSESIIYLQILSFSLMFDHVSSVNLNLLLVKGRSDLVLKLEIIKKTISVLILLFSIPFGVLGVCVSRVIYTQIALIINTYYTGKLFGLGYFQQWKDFSKYVVFSAIACLPVFYLSKIELNNVVIIILGIIISTILYVFLLYITNDFLFRQQVLKKIYKKY